MYEEQRPVRAYRESPQWVSLGLKKTHQPRAEAVVGTRFVLKCSQRFNNALISEGYETDRATDK